MANIVLYNTASQDCSSRSGAVSPAWRGDKEWFGRRRGTAERGRGTARQQTEQRRGLC